jgi:NitT/TauT family transport system substrate-binding protein
VNAPGNIDYGQVDPGIAAVMALDDYPIGVDATRIQRVSDVMYEFGVLARRFDVPSMLLPASLFDFGQFSSSSR